MYELVGYRYVDMMTERGSLKGYSCHFLNHEEQEGFTGAEGLKVFLSDEKFPDLVNDLKLHQRFVLYFSQRGRIQGYMLVDDPVCTEDV